jgi:Tfp pilus assembly protein PilV
MKATQKGFALLEGLLIVLILTIISFGGYYVWQTQKNTDKTSKDAVSASQSTEASSKISLTQALSLDSGKVSLSIPSDWAVISSAQNISGNNCSYTVYANSNFIKCIDGKTTYPASLGSDSSFTLSISAYTAVAGHSDPQVWYGDFSGSTVIKNDQDDTVSTDKINNYTAFYWEQRTPADQEGYTDEHYVVSANNIVVYFVSRIKTTNTSAGYDYSKYLLDIRAIVKSLKIN